MKDDEDYPSCEQQQQQQQQQHFITPFRNYSRYWKDDLINYILASERILRYC